MDVAELERILAEHPWLPKPKYVFMVNERVYGVVDGMVLTYKGATPINSRDRIALTPDADEVTVVHELLHVAGFGEVVAYSFAPLIRRLRKRVPSVFKHEVKLRKIAQPHPSVEIYEVVF
jgi:hypothetical protein